MGRHTKPHTGRLFRPTDEQRRQVLTMTGFGIQQTEIANSLEIDKKTLHKHFRRELDTGMTEANVRVAQALYTNAVKNMNVAAQIWWTKTRMGWKDTSVIETAGTSPMTLHLVAAREVSQQVLDMCLEPQAQVIEDDTTRLLDAPPPTE